MKKVYEYIKYNFKTSEISTKKNIEQRKKFFLKKKNTNKKVKQKNKKRTARKRKRMTFIFWQSKLQVLYKTIIREKW